MTPEEQAADKFLAEFETKHTNPIPNSYRTLIKTSFCAGYCTGQDATATSVADEMLRTFKDMVAQMEAALAEHNQTKENQCQPATQQQ